MPPSFYGTDVRSRPLRPMNFREIFLSSECISRKTPVRRGVRLVFPSTVLSFMGYWHNPMKRKTIAKLNRPERAQNEDSRITLMNTFELIRLLNNVKQKDKEVELCIVSQYDDHVEVLYEDSFEVDDDCNVVVLRTKNAFKGI